MSDPGVGTIAAVTSKGQVTIPREFCDKLHLDPPGRVRFVENDQGEIVVRRVKSPSELRGALASGNEEERSATELLRDERDRDKQKTDEKDGLAEQDG